MVDAVESQSQSGWELRAYLWASGPCVTLILTVWAAAITKSNSGNQRLQLSVSRYTSHSVLTGRQQDSNALTSKNLTCVRLSHLMSSLPPNSVVHRLDKPRCLPSIEKRSQKWVKTSQQEVQSGYENAVSSLKTNKSNSKSREIKQTDTSTATPVCSHHDHTCAHQVLFPLWRTISSRSCPTLNLVLTPTVSADKPPSRKNRESIPPNPPTHTQLRQWNGEKMTNISLSHIESVVILAFQPGEKSYSSEDVPGCIQYIDVQGAVEFNMSLLNIPPRESLLSL